MGSNPEKNLSHWGFRSLLERGWNTNIQIMTELRNKHRFMKRARSDFQSASFSFATSKEDELKKVAKKKYSEFLDSLDSKALKIEAETPSFVKNTESLTVNTTTEDERNV